MFSVPAPSRLRFADAPSGLVVYTCAQRAEQRIATLSATTSRDVVTLRATFGTEPVVARLDLLSVHERGALATDLRQMYAPHEERPYRTRARAIAFLHACALAWDSRRSAV